MSDKEPKLLGNGKLTVAARLGVVGLVVCLPTFGGFLLWFLNETYQEHKANSRRLQSIVEFIAGATERGHALRQSDAAMQADIKELQAGHSDHEKRLIRLESRR